MFPIENLKTITDSLKLKNKYDKSIDQCTIHQSEYSICASNQHTFILCELEINKNEQSIIASINASQNNVDSVFTQTILHKLPSLSQNTHRFISDTSSVLSRTTKLTSKVSKMNRTSQSTITVLNSKPIYSAATKSLQSTNNILSISSANDTHKESITRSKAKQPPTLNEIVLD